MSDISEFTGEYYDIDYFASPEGKKFRRADGSFKYWGYRNPTGHWDSGREIVKAFKEIFSPARMLDVGAGRGQFIAYARDMGIEAEGFDWSKWAVGEGRYIECKHEWLKIHDATQPWDYSDNGFDLVLALDFYEHIYESDLDFVISEMCRVAKRYIFLQIATVDGVKEKGYLLEKGEKIPFETEEKTWAGHTTFCTEEWWYNRLERDDWWPRRDMVNWFCSLVDSEAIGNWLLNSIIVLERIGKL